MNSQTKSQAEATMRLRIVSTLISALPDTAFAVDMGNADGVCLDIHFPPAIADAKERAALIVKAVNNFENMRSALEFYTLNKSDDGTLAKQVLAQLDK